MKRLICFLAAVGIASSLALAQGTKEVKSVNVVGYLKVNVAVGWNQIAFNWKGISLEDTSLQDLFATNGFTRGDDLGNSDRINQWDGLDNKKFYLY